MKEYTFKIKKNSEEKLNFEDDIKNILLHS